MQIIPVTEKDADEVLKMLKKSFFLHETLNASIRLVDEDGGCPALEKYCRDSIPGGLGLQAVDPASGDIAGVVLNGELRRGDPVADAPGPLHTHSTKFDKVLGIIHAAEHKFDLFSAYPEADRALDVMILATHPAHAKKGIATALVEHTIEMARARVVPLVRCVCSGAFSAMVVQRLGFTKLGLLPYSDFLGPDGEPVFCPPPPHEGMSVWALSL